MSGKGKWVHLGQQKIQAILRAAAPIVAGGTSQADAAQQLGIEPSKLHGYIRRHRAYWDQRLSTQRGEGERMRIIRRPPGPAARVQAEIRALLSGPASEAAKPETGDRKPAPAPTEQTEAVLKAAATIVQAGYSVADAADQLGMKPQTLRRYRHKHRGLWDHFSQLAEAESSKPEVVIEKAVPYMQGPFPRKASRDIMLKAIAMMAGGATCRQATEDLGLGTHTIKEWQKRYGDLWKAEWARAMETAASIIGRQAGTDAVLEDPDAYIRRAITAARWAAKEGRPLFAESEKATLGSFYETYYLPTRLADASPRTVGSYRGNVRMWVLFTGDPPLEEISVETLARFRDCLKGMRGKQPHLPMAANTIRSKLRHIQTVLDKAGPAGPRNRDAAGLIPAPIPWVKPPRPEYRTPRIVTLEQLGMVYAAAVGMEVPRFHGIKPPAWWKALLVVAYNTGLRAGTLFSLRMQWVDWKARQLTIPPSKMKTGRGQVIHLNQVTLQHLLRIRTDRELVLPWGWACRLDFYKHFHRLQDLAAIPREEHFGLHDLRRTVATALWQTSPSAAQFHLGHTSMGTTQKHYVMGDSIVARALDELPQPEAFTDNGKRDSA